MIDRVLEDVLGEIEKLAMRLLTPPWLYVTGPLGIALLGVLWWRVPAHQAVALAWLRGHALGVTLGILALLVATLVILRLAGFTLLAWLAQHLPRPRRSRADVIRDWPRLAEGLGLGGSTILGARQDQVGRTYEVQLDRWRGQTLRDLTSRLDRLNSAFQAKEGMVRVVSHPSRRADRCLITVVDHDPLARTIGWPREHIASIREPLRLGVFEDGSEVRVPFWTPSRHPHGLVGGVTGSGKSSLMKALLVNLVSCRDCVVWVIDLKMLEFSGAEGVIDRLAVTPIDAMAILEALLRIMEARKRVLAERRLRDWQPTPDEPLIVLAIDEVSQLDDPALSVVLKLAQLGRALGIQIVIATQQPSARQLESRDASGTALRGQLDLRLCMRVRESRETDLILGQGAQANGWQAESMLRHEGSFFVSLPGVHDVVRVARAYYVDAATEAAVIEAVAASRPHLDPASALAALEPEGESPPISVGPEAALMSLLRGGDKRGWLATELVPEVGRSRAWVFAQLKALEAHGLAVRTGSGRWRSPDSPAESRL